MALPMPIQFEYATHHSRRCHQYIDLIDIFELPDVIVSAADEDMPSLEDILGL